MPVKILVVDDEPDLEPLILQRFRRRIRSDEFLFHFAANGTQALSTLESNPDINIVLTDINMPQMDGLTLLSHLAELDRLLKAVVISAYGDMDNIRTAMNRGAFDFLTKPIDFNDLEITIDKTIRELESLREGVRARTDLMFVQKELDVAAQIQQSLLPKTFPPFPDRPEIDVFAVMEPARQVGGDFYDFFWLDETHLGFTIGDVAGKGVPAAILMAVTRTLVKAIALRGSSPEECLGLVNRILASESAPEMFVTGIFGSLDVTTGRVRYANAGHNAPFHCSAAGGATALPNIGGLVLGILPEAIYTAAEMQLAPGDTLFLYTDGVTEAMNNSRGLYGDDRLSAYMGQVATTLPQAVCAGLSRELVVFIGGAAQHDDITMLALRFNGPAN